MEYFLGVFPGNIWLSGNGERHALIKNESILAGDN